MDIKEYIEQKSITSKLIKFMNVQEGLAENIAYDFEKLLLTNTPKAIKKLGAYLEKARIGDGESYKYDCFVGGPAPEKTAPLYNVLGSIYPALDREHREGILINALSYLNRLNYFNAQNHVERIDEPWLCADICISSGMLYYPGYKEYYDTLKKCETWDDFKPFFKQSKSDFFVSFAIIDSETNKEIIKTFSEKHYDLLDRTLDAVAAITKYKADRISEKENKPVEQVINECNEEIYKTLHKQINQKINEEKWILINPLLSRNF